MTVELGKKAPYFKADATLPNGDFKTLTLDDYKGKWLVLFFYPLDFTFVCPTEIRSFSESYNKFKEIGCEVVGCSIDSKFSHKAWMESDLKGLQIPLIGDVTKEVSRAYGVLNYEAGVAFRGTFVIDPEGTVKSYNVNDLGIGRSVDETLRTVQAAQTGKLTPCNWKPGDKTLN